MRHLQRLRLRRLRPPQGTSVLLRQTVVQFVSSRHLQRPDQRRCCAGVTWSSMYSMANHGGSLWRELGHSSTLKSWIIRRGIDILTHHLDCCDIVRSSKELWCMNLEEADLRCAAICVCRKISELGHRLSSRVPHTTAFISKIRQKFSTTNNFSHEDQQRVTQGMYCPKEWSINPRDLHDRRREKSASTQYATAMRGWEKIPDNAITATDKRENSNWKMPTLLLSFRRAEEPSCQSWGHSPCSEPMKADAAPPDTSFPFTNWESHSATMVKTSVLVSIPHLFISFACLAGCLLSRCILKVPYLLEDLVFKISSSKQYWLGLDLERCAQCHQQRREVWKATGSDPTLLQGHCQVSQRHAEARYVSHNFNIHIYSAW
jgi:hypothetical protein